MFSKLVLALSLLAVSINIVGGNPVVVRERNAVTLPFAKRVHTAGMSQVLKIDQARAEQFRSRSAALKNADAPHQARDVAAATFGIPSTSRAVEYTVSVGVGTPPEQYTLLVDTGSSNTWIGADWGHKFVQTPSAVDTGNDLYVEYGTGASLVLGEQWNDTLTLSPDLAIENFGVGVALIAIGFDGLDGIIGLGPQVLTYQTLFPAGGYVPTVTDTLFDIGEITSYRVSICMEPTATNGTTNGEITFGGEDSSKYTGDLNFVPTTTTYPSIYYIGINQTLTHGSEKTLLLNNTAGITDTGTTLFLLATDAFETYTQKTGAELDPDIGLLRLPASDYSKLESMHVTIGSETYEFTANAQIWPRALNSAINGTSDYVYLIVNDIGTPSGVGMDFVNGMTFLERFYHVYDIGHNQFGIATTQFTTAEIN